MTTDYLFTPVEVPVPMDQIDTTKQRDNIKLDPLKIFLNEISVSYEHFNKSREIDSPASNLTGIDSIISKRKAEKISSIHYIFGFNYPSDFVNSAQYKQDINYMFIEKFDDIGLSPFINWGASVKFEFRRYRKTFYYGPQFMEKFIFYPKTYVDEESGPELEGVIRLQSGQANVLGIGYSIGWQKVYKGFVTDLFFGVGGRLRLAVKKIYEEQNNMGPNVIYEDPITENLSRLYPSLNLGIRVGFNL